MKQPYWRSGETLYRKFILTLVFTLCLFSLIVIAVESYDPAYEIDAIFGSTPNIDGVITSGEWDDASTVSFNNTVVYVKQDGENLYVAFNVSDNSVENQDVVAIFIDVENNGGSSPQPDDISFYITRMGSLMERQGSNPPVNPTGGWSAYYSSTSSNWQSEFNITYAKVEITPGVAKTLGMALESWDYSAGLPLFWPPMTPMESNYPSNWGNLISEMSWVPEFPTFLILPIFMIATLLAVIVSKRKTNIKQDK